MQRWKISVGGDAFGQRQLAKIHTGQAQAFGLLPIGVEDPLKEGF
jgi:hypothetical protein